MPRLSSAHRLAIGAAILHAVALVALSVIRLPFAGRMTAYAYHPAAATAALLALAVVLAFVVLGRARPARMAATVVLVHVGWLLWRVHSDAPPATARRAIDAITAQVPGALSLTWQAGVLAVTALAVLLGVLTLPARDAARSPAARDA